ncbi:Fasciclin-like arabinogalactan protein 8 [Linum perenne]
MAASIYFLLFLALSAAAVSAHNITEILSSPDYSQFNDYLTKTGLADEINSRQTITVLALNNGAMSDLAKHPVSVVKKALSLLVVLDYFDPTKLHKITDGSLISTTLYQTTGNAPGNFGFVNITDLKGGKVGFGSAAPGSKLDSSYVKSVKQIPYNISVVEISAPVIAPGMLTAPAPSASDVNITALLEKAGCKTFAGLLQSSGVLKAFVAAADKGLTVFAPNDEAFKAPGVPDLAKLTNADTVSLLQFHGVPTYKPLGSLKAGKGPISTLASNGAGKYQLTATTSGDEVVLHTGVAPSRVADTILDSTPLMIFSVDNVLLPEELFGKSPTPSPAPAPGPATTPSPSPAPSSVEAPSPLAASPPAPPAGTPGDSPADAPDGGSESSTADNNAAVHVNGGSGFLSAVVAVAATGFCSVLF